MNGIVRRAILGKVPVYGICDRHHVPPHRAWYGVRHPCGQTHVLFFTDNTHAYAVAEMLDGYRERHGEYPPNDVLGFDTPGTAWSGDLCIDEVRLDLFMRNARGSGMGYSVIFDVDDDGTFMAKDLSLPDVAHRRAFMDRQLALPAHGARGGGGASSIVPFFDSRNPLYRPKKK